MSMKLPAWYTGLTDAGATLKPFAWAGRALSGIGKNQPPDPRTQDPYTTRSMRKFLEKSLPAGDFARSLRLGGQAKAINEPIRKAQAAEVARVDSLFPSAPGRSESVFKNVRVDGQDLPDRQQSFGGLAADNDALGVAQVRADKDAAHAKDLAGIRAAGTERRSIMQTQHDERMAKLTKQFGGPAVGRVASDEAIAKASQQAERRKLLGSMAGNMSFAPSAGDKAATKDQRSRFDAGRKIAAGPKGTMAKPAGLAPVAPAPGTEDDETV